jgi:hypothetical protein
MPTTTYRHVRKELKTGDIVLFSRKNVPMTLWQWITDCRWTHVGMVIRSDETRQVLLWESTTLSNLRDHFTGRFKAGVQAVLLSRRIETYNGDVAFRQLDCSLDDQAKRLMDERLYEFRKIVQDRPFETNFAELLRAFIDVCRSHTKPPKSQSSDTIDRSPKIRKGRYRSRRWDSLFCSELVAAAYQAMGLLDPAVKPANEYTPRDFSEDPRTPLCLNFGASLGEETGITCG